MKLSMSRTIEAIYRNGHVELPPDVQLPDNTPVTVLVHENTASLLVDQEAWNTLEQLVAQCSVETGIADLAHQHDHYLYGKPKKE
jgi:hypothetical protein